MVKSLSFEAPARRGGDAPDTPAPEYGPEDFPGCESFPLSESALEDYEGRLEFWDGRTETAWKVAEPPSFHHEGPSQRLVEMATRVASLRGSPIACFGSAGLVRRDAAGRKRWLMQADQVLFLHPERVRWRRALDVDTDPLPDVVLEVDHSTDVRRRKLGIYMESGFPEIWVVVPWESSRRSAGAGDPRAPGREVPGGGGEPGLSGVEGRGDLRGADRDPLVGEDGTRDRAGGARDGRARGHEARGRPFHLLGECEGAGGRPREGLREGPGGG